MEDNIQASLNSVSRASLVDGEWVNDFFGNDLAFAHTTEETNKKAFTTLPEPSDYEIYNPEEESEPEGEDESQDPDEDQDPAPEGGNQNPAS